MDLTEGAFMYRKIEEDRELVLAEEETPEAECVCACRAEKQDSEEPSPEALFAITSAAVHYDING